MSVKLEFLALALAAAGAAAAIASAPTSAAHTDAASTIDDLQAQGYDVQINWVRGYSSAPLSSCSVNAIHNPDRSGDGPDTFTTVYVDVSCPTEEPNFSGSIGFGVGF